MNLNANATIQTTSSLSNSFSIMFENQEKILRRIFFPAESSILQTQKSLEAIKFFIPPDGNSNYLITNGKGKYDTESWLIQPIENFIAEHGKILHYNYQLKGGMKSEVEIQNEAYTIISQSNPCIKSSEENKIYHEFEIWT
jgi:hypothetical protein